MAVWASCAMTRHSKYHIFYFKEKKLFTHVRKFCQTLNRAKLPYFQKHTLKYTISVKCMFVTFRRSGHDLPDLQYLPIADIYPLVYNNIHLLPCRKTCLSKSKGRPKPPVREETYRKLYRSLGVALYIIFLNVVQVFCFSQQDILKPSVKT